MTNKAKEEFNEWLKDRPQVIKDIAAKCPPWNLYRIKKTGQHCEVLSYFENGTLMVGVNGHDNEHLNKMNIMQPFGVFGISPDDLVILENLTKSTKQSDN